MHPLIFDGDTSSEEDNKIPEIPAKFEYLEQLGEDIPLTIFRFLSLRNLFASLPTEKGDGIFSTSLKKALRNYKYFVEFEYRHERESVTQVLKHCGRLERLSILPNRHRTWYDGLEKPDDYFKFFVDPKYNFRNSLIELRHPTLEDFPDTQFKKLEKLIVFESCHLFKAENFPNLTSLQLGDYVPGKQSKTGNREKLMTMMKEQFLKLPRTVTTLSVMVNNNELVVDLELYKHLKKLRLTINNCTDMTALNGKFPNVEHLVLTGSCPLGIEKVFPAGLKALSFIPLHSQGFRAPADGIEPLIEANYETLSYLALNFADQYFDLLENCSRKGMKLDVLKLIENTTTPPNTFLKGSFCENIKKIEFSILPHISWCGTGLDWNAWPRFYKQFKELFPDCKNEEISHTGEDWL